MEWLPLIILLLIWLIIYPVLSVRHDNKRKQAQRSNPIREDSAGDDFGF